MPCSCLFPPEYLAVSVVGVEDGSAAETGSVWMGKGEMNYSVAVTEGKSTLRDGPCKRRVKLTSCLLCLLSFPIMHPPPWMVLPPHTGAACCAGPPM